MSLQACHVLSHRQLDQEFCVIASAGKIQGEFFNTIGQNRTFMPALRSEDSLRPSAELVELAKLADFDEPYLVHSDGS